MRTEYKISLQFPEGTPIRTRIRLSWAVIKFLRAFDRASLETQNRILDSLALQDGVTVSLTREKTES
jgi:hypothetical protein